MSKRITIIIITSLFFIIGGWYVCFQSGLFGKFKIKEPIKVGILHSLTGTMAISEKAVVDSTLFAIKEINRQGGVLGRKIEPVVVDGKSDLKTFAIEAERLIVVEKVSVVFGCWTSASRKTVKPIFERYKHLLFYPVQYEGLEQSPNIVYTGATPNQQIVPAVEWSFEHLGRKFFLVGSDYIYPRVANTIIKDKIAALDGEVAGEEYLLLGSKDVEGIVQKIVETKPDIILNTINGDSNTAFFKELRNTGITSDIIPTMSFSISENELRDIGTSNMVGDYACWNYFQSIKTDENENFVSAFKERYGKDRAVSDPMEAAYLGVYLWALAVEHANTDNVHDVRESLRKQSIVAPEGVVHFCFTNNHVLKHSRIGRVKEDGQFEILWTSKDIIRPMPYLAYRTKKEWNQLVRKLYDGWGESWAAGGE